MPNKIFIGSLGFLKYFWNIGKIFQYGSVCNYNGAKGTTWVGWGAWVWACYSPASIIMQITHEQYAVRVRCGAAGASHAHPGVGDR